MDLLESAPAKPWFDGEYFTTTDSSSPARQTGSQKPSTPKFENQLQQIQQTNLNSLPPAINDNMVGGCARVCAQPPGQLPCHRHQPRHLSRPGRPMDPRPQVHHSRQGTERVRRDDPAPKEILCHMVHSSTTTPSGTTGCCLEASFREVAFYDAGWNDTLRVRAEDGGPRMTCCEPTSAVMGWHCDELKSLQERAVELGDTARMRREEQQRERSGAREEEGRDGYRTLGARPQRRGPGYHGGRGGEAWTCRRSFDCVAHKEKDVLVCLRDVGTQGGHVGTTATTSSTTWTRGGTQSTAP